ncbi:hypothetical protein LX64_02497 [Chitinophaga skermanii]|uniref:Lmo0937 family membrane protein n=1 Tax=Chitinophaga skermanii TaxID=331697 RepID=A0A327QLY3_9BACT|nr:lmo0937 family membrane protein [Chitinophaga skermanii]RAJ05340.1 hypothetical protein LX64_02497 [Chitinophaga skermanii]
MSNLLYFIAVVFIVLWIAGYFFHVFGNTGAIVHVLLVIAIISLVIKVVRRISS